MTTKTFPHKAITLHRADILGVHISAISMRQAVDTIDSWITEKSPHYVCVTPAHGIMECQRNPALKGIFNQSGLTTPDGMAIVWLLKLKGYPHVTRVYGPDLMQAVCKRSVEGGAYRHFFFGGAPGVAEKLSARLQAQFPGLKVVGVYCPPFRALTEEEDENLIQQIRTAQPDILWVGVSTPKQEVWMADHIGRIGVPVMVGVGAAFDFLSGTKKQAPRWIRSLGFEWLFRLLSEPKRLAPRYAEYPKFVFMVIQQLIQERSRRRS